jgi:hypothetical protein
MPTFLPPEAVRFELRNDEPVVTLAVDLPTGAVAEAWSVLNRLTMVLVDGPDDHGFLLPRLGPNGNAAPEGWDEAVTRAGGSHVIFGPHRDAPAVFARVLR